MFLSGRHPFVVVCCLVAWGGAAPASAQTKAPNNAAEPKFAVPGSLDSASTGRRGGGSNSSDKSSKPSRVKKGAKHRPNAPVATFPGFRLMPDGSSRIYVELSKTVSVDERRSAGTLTFTLRGAEVLARNNKNALITTHFSTPVDRARLVPAGSDLDLVIDLRQTVSPTHQIVPGQNGSARLEIDFPAGDYPLNVQRFGPPPGGRGEGNTSRNPNHGQSPATDEPEPASPPTENDAVGPASP